MPGDESVGDVVERVVLVDLIVSYLRTQTCLKMTKKIVADLRFLHFLFEEIVLLSKRRGEVTIRLFRNSRHV